MRLGKARIKKWHKDLSKARKLIQDTESEMKNVYLNSKGGRLQNVSQARFFLPGMDHPLKGSIERVEYLAKAEGVEL